MRLSRFLSIAAAVLPAAAIPSAAHAVLVYAVNNSTGLLTSQIVTFDTATPTSVTVLGSTGISGMVGTTNGMAGLSFDSAGNLWGYGGGSTSGLYSVNKTTGAATLISATTGLASGDAPRDMAYNPLTGKLTIVTYNLSVSKLYTVDTTTGVATVVGTLNGTPNNFAGLAYKADGSGFLYNFTNDQIFTLSGLNATDMSSGKVGVTGSGSINIGLDYDWSRTSDLLLNWVGSSGAAGTGYVINTTTGAGTSIVSSTSRTFGDFAIVPVVPEPASAGLLAAAVTGLALRRRR